MGANHTCARRRNWLEREGAQARVLTERVSDADVEEAARTWHLHPHSSGREDHIGHLLNERRTRNVVLRSLTTAT